MSKFFKSLLLLLSAGLFTATSWAVDPVAEWTNFSDFENNELANNGYTLTKTDDSRVNLDGSITLGGAGLSLPVSGHQITVVMDVSGAPTTDGITIASVKMNGSYVSLKSDGTQLAQCWNNTDNNGTYGRFNWTPAKRQTIVLGTMQANPSGTTTWIDGVQKATYAGLMTANGSLENVYIGSYKGTEADGTVTGSAAGMTVHSLRIYSTKLTETLDIHQAILPSTGWVASFEGNNSMTGWATGFDGGAPSTYVKTPKGQGFNISNGNPWKSINDKSAYSVALYADISAAPTNAHLFTFNAEADKGLRKTATNKVTFNGLEIEENSLSTLGKFHLFVFGSNSDGSFLSVDGEMEENTTSLGSIAGFQIGDRHGGGGTRSNGMIVDEIRGYDARLNRSDISRLVSLFPCGMVEYLRKYSFTEKSANTLWNFSSTIKMPPATPTSFTATVRWVDGSKRVEIAGIKLIDTAGNEYIGTTATTDASYAGSYTANNVYTFTNDRGFSSNETYTLSAVFWVDTTASHDGEIELSNDVKFVDEAFSSSEAGSLTMPAQRLQRNEGGITIPSNFDLTVVGDVNGTAVSKSIVVSGSGTLRAKRGLTFTGGLSGAGQIVAEGEGSVLDLTSATVTDFTGSYAVTNGATLILPMGATEGRVIEVDASTLKVKVGSYESVTLETVTLLDGASVYFVLPDGREIVGEVDGSNVTMPSQTLYTYTATDGTNNWTDEKWTQNGTPVKAPTGKFDGRVKVVLTSATILTMDADVEMQGLLIEGGELTISGEKTLTTTIIESSNKVCVSGAVIVNGGTNAFPANITNVIEVADGGTLTTKGYLNLTAENQVKSGGTLEVLSGTTSFGGTEKGLAGDIAIAQGATLVNTRTSDALNYNATLTVDVYGTLNMGSTRWTMGANNTLNVYSGATITGSGQGENGALDWYRAATFNVKKSNTDGTNAVTISANLRTRDQGNIKFMLEEEMTATLSGVIRGNKAVTVNGAGTLKLTGANTYTGGTTIAKDATLEANTIDNLPATGPIEVNGRLRLVNSGNVNHSGSSRYMVTTTTGEGDAAVTTTSPRLTGSGVLEVASTGYYAFPNGFMTPLAFENNCAEGVVVANMAGMTIGTLSGSGKFRSDLGTNDAAGDARVLTVKQSAASFFSGTFRDVSATGTRSLVFAIEKAEGVAEGTDTTLTLSGNTDLNGVSLSVAAGASVNVTGAWAQPADVSGTLAGTGTINGTLTFNEGATLDVTDGAITATGAVNLPDGTLTVKITEDQDVTGSVTLLNAAELDAADVTIPDGMAVTVMVGKTEGMNEYTVTHDTDAKLVKLIVEEREVVAEVNATFSVAGGTLKLSDVLSEGAVIAPNATLVINFGDADEGEAPTPGTFEFDKTGSFTFSSVRVTGTNGGTITKSEEAAIEATSTAIDTNTTIDAGVGDFGAVTIADGKTLTVKDDCYEEVTFASASSAIKFMGDDSMTEVPFLNVTGTKIFSRPIETTALNVGTRNNGAAEQTIVFNEDVTLGDGSQSRQLLTFGAGKNQKQTITQNADITISLNSVVDATNEDAPVIFAHWHMDQGYLTNYNLQEGTFDNKDGSTLLSWDGGTTLTIAKANGTSTSAVFKTYSMRNKQNGGDRPSQIIINPNGRLEIGEGGLHLGNGGQTTNMTLAGGTLQFAGGGSPNVKNGTSVTADSKIISDPASELDLANLRLSLTSGKTLTLEQGKFKVANNAGISAESGAVLVIDGATLDLTVADFSNYKGAYSVTNGGTLILPAGKENGASVTSGTLMLLLSPEQLIDGYTANVANGTSVTFVKAGAEDYVRVEAEGNVYTPAMNTWEAKDGNLWDNDENWSMEVAPSENDDVIIEITDNTTIIIPTEGVTVGILTVNGEGTLTIDGGKLTATKIYANAKIAATEGTLALAPMNIAEGKTVTYTTTTTMADPDSMGASSHALALKEMTGAGTFVKTGIGVIGLFKKAAEPAIIVEEGAIYVREEPTTAMNIAAKAGTEIRLCAWHVDFANNANKITLDGGAQLTLANGANVSGTITIANAAATAAKICGSSFNDSTIAAAITGAGKVEFAKDGAFGEDKYPCDGATTYSGVISDDLQVIVSDTSAVTFSGTNTYTGGTVIVTGAKLTTAVASLSGAITLQEGAVLIDDTAAGTATDLGTRTITVTRSDAEGDRAVIVRNNPCNINTDTFVMSGVTLTGSGNLVLAGKSGNVDTPVVQTLEFAAGTDFSGEISVFNQFNKGAVVTVVGNYLANATYTFASVTGYNTETGGDHTLTVTGEATLKAIKRDSAWTAATQLNIPQDAHLTLTTGDSTISTIDGIGTLNVSSTAKLTMEDESSYGGTINVNGKLYLTRAFTLTDGAKLDLKTNSLVGNALTTEALIVTFNSGATLMRNLGVLSANVVLNGGAILDYTNVQEEETSVLDVTGTLTLNIREDRKIIVKGLAADYKDSFLVCLNESWESNVKDKFDFQDANGTPIGPTNRFAAGITYAGKIPRASLGFVQVDASITESETPLPEDVLDEICGLALGGGCDNIVAIQKANYAECFTGCSLILDANDVRGQVEVCANFGVGNVTVSPRTVNDETVQQVAVAVKVTDGGFGWGEEYAYPAYLREGTKIHLSTDGKPRDVPNKVWAEATALSDVELEAAGLTNGEGIYWYWAGDLPTIQEGATSKTLNYDVKAVNQQ